MGVAVFFVLTAAVAAALIYPLLPGRTPAQESPALTDGDIEQLVRKVRSARGGDGLYCPTCGTAYQAADRYCGRCGRELPQMRTASVDSECPACGATLREGDLFCAKCGHKTAVGEVA